MEVNATEIECGRETRDVAWERPDSEEDTLLPLLFRCFSFLFTFLLFD